MKKQVLIRYLDHDGVCNNLPFAHLHNKWKIGEKVRITVESLVDRTVAKARKASRKVRTT